MPGERRNADGKIVAVLDRIQVWFAVLALIASVAVFVSVALAVREGVWRDLILAVLSNIVTSCVIYIILYVVLKQAVEVRQEKFRDDLVRDITAALSAGRTVDVKVADEIPGATDGGYLPYKHISAEQSDILRRFLLTIHPLVAALTKNQDIRLYCHIADLSEGLLHPVAVASARRDYDYRVAIPLSGGKSAPFVVARAMAEEKTVAENLPTNHADFYPPDLKAKIQPALKCVFAVPIFAYEVPGHDEARRPIGTVAIDCTSATLGELGLVDTRGFIVPEIDDILKSCASVVYSILTSAGLVPKEPRGAVC